MIRAAAIVSLMATSAAAQSSCAPRNSVTERLKVTYDETPLGAGLQSGTRIFEVWSNDVTGTWTILLTRADGIACIMATGTNWRGRRQPPRKKGVPG